MFDRLPAMHSSPLPFRKRTVAERSGWEGLGDNLGAFVGPLAGVFLLVTLHVQLRAIFYMATIPGLLAVCMIALVRDACRAIDANDGVGIEHGEKALEVAGARRPQERLHDFALTRLAGV